MELNNSVFNVGTVKSEWVEKGYWVEPNLETLDINFDNLNEYWYWIHERMNIWDKRVNQGLPVPWTDDEVLRDYKFTNPIRDLDRLSLYYIDNYVTKLEDNENSKKTFILNTMIYRLFLRLETLDEIGYIHIDNWETEWPKAKERVRARRESGESMFTSAYYVNSLKAVNPDPATNSNKTENALIMIEGWHKNIDEIYQKAFVEATDMAEQIEYFKTLPAIGHFTSYEWACDFCLPERYAGIKLVDWDDDSYTNVGPGAKRGINWIFKNRGGMNDLQTIFWLRSIANSEFERLGYTDTMKWPNKVKDFNLRIIEHSLTNSDFLQ